MRSKILAFVVSVCSVVACFAPTENAFAYTCAPYGGPGKGCLLGSTDTRPMGFFDGYDTNSCVIFGWGCNRSNSCFSCDQQYVNIHVYADGPAGVGSIITGGPALQVRSDVTSTCGGNDHQGFAFPLPDSFKNGVPRALWIYAISVTGQVELVTNGSGVTVVCQPPPTATPVPTATFTPPPPPATATPTSTSTSVVPTATPTKTPVPATPTPTLTPTKTPVAPTVTPTPRPTKTKTPIPTATPTEKPKYTKTPTPSPTPTCTEPPKKTKTPTPTPTATATATPTPVDITNSGCVNYLTETGSGGSHNPKSYTMVFQYTNTNSTTLVRPISPDNFMFVGCQVKPFVMSQDVRVERNLRQNPQDLNSPYLGTVFIPASRLNEASIEIAPPEQCVTWCLGADAASGTPKCLTLSLDPALSSIKDDSRICPESKVIAAISEPAYKCEGTTTKTLITDVSAMITGGANATWNVTCPVGKNVTITPMDRMVRLSILATEAPVTCAVELTASLGGYSVKTSRNVELTSASVPAGQCIDSAPVDLCQVPNGNNSCLDCKGIPFGPNVVVPECGCINPNNPNDITACYKCTKTDISTIQAAVDSRLKDMEFLINRMLAAEAKLLGKSPVKFKTNIKEAAYTAQNSGWTIVWTKIEKQVYDCPAPLSSQVCTLIPPTEQLKALNTITCHANNLLFLGKKVESSIKKNANRAGVPTSAKNRALRTARVRFGQLKEIHDAEVLGISKLPNTYVSCSAQGAEVKIEANLTCKPLT